MKIVQLTTDAREHYRDYDKQTPYFGTAPEALLQGFAQLPDLEVHVVSCTQQPMHSPAKLADNIWFHSLHVPKIGWLKTGYQGCIRAVRRKLRQINPDIVHGQGTERDCAISGVFSGFPNVVTIHGNMIQMASVTGNTPSFLRFATFLENVALRRTLGVFCNSGFTESVVRTRARRLWRVANAVRKEFFDVGIPSQQERRKILLNVGLISRHKRQLELLDFARQLYRKGGECKFEFVGSVARDSYGAAFLEKITAAEQEGFACHRGFVDSTEIIRLYDSACGLVHVPIAESFGLVVAESLARNLKFFGSKIGGIPDITRNAEGAELFQPDDWIGLGAAIEKWISLGGVRPDKAAAAMRKQYHPVHIAKQHLEIYQEILSSES